MSWSNILTASQFNGYTGKTLAAVRNVKATICAQNWFYAQCLATDDSLWVGRTPNRGNTWFFSNVGTVTATDVAFGFAVSQHDALKCWSCGADGVLKGSVDGAVSFLTLYTVSGAQKPIAAIEVQYADNADDQTVYISTDVSFAIPLIIIRTTQGVFYSDTVGDSTPVWTEANDGLTAGQKTSVRSIAFDRLHGDALYMTCGDGLFRNMNITSGGTWQQVATNADAITMINAAGGSCTPITDPGAWFSICCHAEDSRVEVIAGGSKNPHGALDSHKRVFYSADRLATVSVGASLKVHSNHCEISNGNSISAYDGRSCYSYYCAWWPGADSRKSHSDDGGLSIAGTYGFEGFTAAVRYHSRSGYYLLFWRTGATTLWKSVDGGQNVTALGAVLPANPSALMLHPNDINSAMAFASVLRNSTTGGTTWTTSPTNISGVACIGPVPGHRNKWLVGRNNSPTACIYYTPDFATTWSNKTGNLNTFLGATDDVRQIVYGGGLLGPGVSGTMLMKSVNGGGAFSDVTPTQGGLTAFCSMEVATQDGQTIYTLVRADDTEEHHAVLSEDGAGSWTEKSDFNSIAPADADGQASLGAWPFDVNTGYALQYRDPGGTPTDMILSSADLMANWSDKSGDWQTAIQGTWGLNKGYAGSCLPVWMP